MFVGAREMFQRGDAEFARRATRRARFGGGYEPFALPAAGSRPEIVAGALKQAPDKDDLVSVAHGWFLDGNGDVLDVAVFFARSELTDLASCRRLAQKIIGSVTLGKRTLVYGTGAAVETRVSYATFRYRLGTDWTMVDTVGIHDFARMQFRKRGVFPRWGTDLQIGLDSHPGDWKSPGSEGGQREGKLLGQPAQWHLTADSTTPLSGAWAVSSGASGRGHAVASLFSPTEQERDEGVSFAQSIAVVPSP